MMKLSYKVIEPRFQPLLPDATFDEFVSRRDDQVASPVALTAGRGGSSVLRLPAGEQIVIRHFRRGGWIKNILKASYLRNPFAQLGSERPFIELAILRMLYKKEISVPEPVGAAVAVGAFGLSYQGIIATVFIPESKNLLTLFQDIKSTGGRSETLARYCYLAGKEAAKMVAAGVYHPDLHLGNVLCKSDDGVILIDFDRATHGASNEAATKRGLLLQRWKRSSVKHAVSSIADIPFEQGLNGGEM